MKTIKKLVILLIYIASFNSFAQEVIIENDNVTGIYHVVSLSSIGQSFTATVNGEITKIQVVSTTATNTTLTLYDGPLRTGPVLHTQSVNLTNTYTDNSNYTYTTIVLDTPISVINGNMYRFEFGLSNLVNDNAGNYLSGDMYDGASLVVNNDLTFKVVQQLIIPKVISVERLIPLTEGTTASTVTFRVTFNDPVVNVDSTDFTLNTTTGGSINSISAVSTSVYDVEITGMTTIGTVGLDIKGVNGVVGSNDIISIANSLPLATTAPTTYETYTKTIKPVVTTTTATNITPTTATLGGNVTEDAGSSVTERGILYSITDNNPEIGDTDVIKDDNGTGTGVFTEDFTGFTANATYYYRAYAINSNGIGYGDIKTFTFNNALNFQSSGSNLVSIPDNVAFDFSAGFTMEAWVKPSAFTASRTVFSQYSSNQRAFAVITKSDGSVEVTVSTTGTSEAYYITANTLTLNVWQHIALTYDGTSVQFYINGIEAGIDGSVVGTISGTMHNSTEPILLGSRSNALFYEGDMDEVRIWTRALTTTEVNNQQYIDIPPNTTGLVAYYKMDQGIAGGDNTAITTLTDSGVNGLNGTLTNFTRTGTTSNFVTGVPGISGILTTTIPDANFEAFLEANAMGDGIASNQLVATANINTVTTLNVNNLNIADLTGIEDFTALTSLNCQNNVLTSLNVANNTALTNLICSVNQLTSLDVRNGNNNNISLTSFVTTDNPNLTCISVDDVAYSTAIWTNIDAQTVFSLDCAALNPNNALNFQSSGSNLVSIPDNAAFDFSAGFTMEAWIRPSSFDGNLTIFSQYTSSQRAFAVIIKANGAVEVTISTTGNTEGYYITANTLTLDTWQHIALTYDGTAARFYINGIEAGIDGSVIGIENVNGAMHNSTEPILLGSRSNVLFYEGDMDEVRIWTKALTVTEINDQKNVDIPSTTTGLAAYYKMDQGIAGGDNTAITTLTDSGVNGLNGTLTNFTKTGTTSNFVTGLPVGSLSVNESIFNASEMPIVYPNPIHNGVINVKISNTLLTNSKKLTYKIYNTVGGIIKEGVLTDVENQISVGNLTSGIYLVRISNNENSVIKKIIIQ